MGDKRESGQSEVRRHPTRKGLLPSVLNASHGALSQVCGTPQWQALS